MFYSVFRIVRLNFAFFNVWIRFVYVFRGFKVFVSRSCLQVASIIRNSQLTTRKSQIANRKSQMANRNSQARNAQLANLPLALETRSLL